jgi:hypothetical protein
MIVPKENWGFNNKAQQTTTTPLLVFTSCQAPPAEINNIILIFVIPVN